MRGPPQGAHQRSSRDTTDYFQIRVCIYDIELDIYIHTAWGSEPQDGFLQRLRLVLSGPWPRNLGPCHTAIFQRQGGVCTFLVAPLWILIGRKKQKKKKRDILNSLSFFI